MEYSISLGNLLTIGSFCVFVTVYVVNSRGAAKVLATKLQMVDTSIGEFKQEMKQLSVVIIEQTRQEGSIALIRQQMLQEGKRLDDLARNIGEFKNIMIRDKLAP